MLTRSLLLLLSSLIAGAAAAEPPGPSSLPTATAELRSIPREYRLDGVVEAIRRTTVSAQTQGQIEAIRYDVDDYVEKGAILLRLRDTEHRTRVTQAAADLKSATAKLEQTREEYQRIEELFAKRNVSESQMDGAAADLEAAQAALESATAQLEQAQEQLSYTEIRAPYSGIVTPRHVELGETATPGAPVMTGISLEELRVVVEVPQSLIPAVRSGSEIQVYLPDGDRLAVTDVTVFPFADMGSNTFTVRLRLPVGTRSLFPGMYVKTGFVTGERRELVVPRAAVVYRSELTAVYVQDDAGRLALRQIRAGRTVDDQIVVLAGLDAGEQVALDPLAASRLIKAQSTAQTAPATEGHGDD